MSRGRSVASRVAGLALAAAGVSIVIGWCCALWSPLRASRRLGTDEAGAIIARRLGPATLHGPPSGIRNWGVGCAFELAVNAPMRPPPFEPLSAVKPPPNVAFAKVPGGPEDLSVQTLAAGWPVPCLEGWVTSVGEAHDGAWLMKLPPAFVNRLGARPLRALPLRPRVAGLAVDAALYAGVFWCAVPGPRLLLRRLRRARGRCAACGYDLAHLEQPGCPECGAARF